MAHFLVLVERRNGVPKEIIRHDCFEAVSPEVVYDELRGSHERFNLLNR